MSLRESKGNMYSWITHQWNPLSGKCEHDCSYCYVKKWGEPKPIHLNESFFKDDLGGGKTIFVVSGADLFADNIPLDWIIRILDYCNRFPDNKYLFQSKNTSKMCGLWKQMPKNSVLCTTLETNRMYSQMGNTPTPYWRVQYLSRISSVKTTYVTIEPIMDFDFGEFVSYLKQCRPLQVNIGADSGNNNLPEPAKDKILALIEELKKFTTIDQKRNLSRLLK